jgi:type I restriction enzyme S subunit
VSLKTFFDNFALLADTPNGVVELREIILQLAIRGKLESQDQNDHSAVQLLKEIKSAKMQADKVKKSRVSDSVFPVELSELPFEIPHNWCWTRIGDAMNLINGRAFKPTDWSSKGIPIVRIQNLNNNSAPFNYCDFDVDEKFFIGNSDLLISWSGTPGTSFGAFIWNGGRAILNQHIFRVEPYGKAYDKPFLRLAINARLDEMIAQAHGAVGLQHITKGKLENLIISLPPLEEQKRIVTKVDELMQLCDELDARQQARRASRVRLNNTTLAPLNKAVSLAREEFEQASLRLADNFATLYKSAEMVVKLRSTILQLAIQGKLVPQDAQGASASALLHRIRVTRERLVKEKKIKEARLLTPVSKDEQPFEIPDNWLWVRLGEIGITQTGTTPAKGDYECFGTDFPFIKPADILPSCVNYNNEGLSKKGVQKYGRLATKGSVLMVCIGTIGKANVIERDCSFNQQINSLSPIADTDSYLINYFLRSDYFQKASWTRANRTTIAILNKGNWENIPFPLPPPEEQKRIVAKVNQLMMLCGELETKLRQTEADSEKLMKAAARDLLASISKSPQEESLSVIA